EPRFLLAQNVSTCIDPLEVCLHRQTVQDTVHVFQHSIPTEGKPVTNQKNSGRCWIFSCLNVMRLPFMKKFNIEEFEFSQSYLFFWDKVERCYYFLHACVETAQRNESVDGRLVQFLLSNPTNDGGQWDMLVNLIEKYGVVPKKCFPESHSSEASRRMNDILNHKLREYCLTLRNMVDNEATKTKLSDTIDTMIEEVSCFVEQTCSLFYGNGIREKHRTLKLIDKNSACNNVCPYELVSFWHQAVWFGCDVGKHFHSKLGINDMNVFNHDLVFGISVKNLSKAERLIFGDSMMTHAMILTAVTDKNGKEGCYEKWRVENSWGDDRGNKGYLIMTDEWFSEYVYEVVVDKNFLPPEVLDVMQQDPIVLPAWDPMGALA
uniref:Bleomycin hydrolase n=1 Tax=Cyprinus carpio TaxID=7962 RepID=A0A8C1S765_CYPCA